MQQMMSDICLTNNNTMCQTNDQSPFERRRDFLFVSQTLPVNTEAPPFVYPTARQSKYKKILTAIYLYVYVIIIIC